MANFEIICNAYEAPEALHFSNKLISIEAYGKGKYEHCIIDTDLEEISLYGHLSVLATYCDRYKVFRGSKLIARSALI